MLSYKSQPNPTPIPPSTLPTRHLQQKKLLAQWLQVNGRLVCQWVVEDDS
ncbi:MAG: hypothetical protein KME16_00255 [Scytolyngbya sp. HA4215-MV1]|nr:hypothetical protein [Scytolyngbya sp. HA4215-MV1]